MSEIKISVCKNTMLNSVLNNILMRKQCSMYALTLAVAQKWEHCILFRTFHETDKITLTTGLMYETW
jgi:hypothetical protein